MWTIIVRDAQGTEQSRVELQQGTLTVGREKDRGLVLPSSSVSRKHARFEVRDGRLLFFDEGSANGSLIDGKRVVAPVEVSERNSIEITPFVLSVEKTAEDEERTVMIRRPAAPRPAAAPPPPPSPPRPAVPPPRPAAPPPPPPPPPPPRPAATPSLPPLPPLQPMAPPPRPAAAAPNPFAAPALPGAGIVNPADDWAAAAAELDRQIQGIRSHRETAETSARTRVIQLDQDWGKVVMAMQAVRQKLVGNPRVLSFNISRDGKEIAVKIQDARERLGYRYFLLSREHPDGKYAGLEAVWLRELGREDKDFRDPKEAQTELLQRIAATLA